MEKDKPVLCYKVDNNKVCNRPMEYTGKTDMGKSPCDEATYLYSCPVHGLVRVVIE